MIPQAFVTEWRVRHPWPTDEQVEQDLVISRALVDIFDEPFLNTSVAFRGGTALHKLYLTPPARHSVDIDLVQVAAGPIASIFDALHNQLDSWLGRPHRKQSTGLATLRYRYPSVTGIQQTLKVEINTREHFFVLPPARLPFEVRSRWFTGTADVLTYSLEELLATKFRALYRRSAGRDAFDLVYALEQRPDLDRSQIVRCFLEYETRRNQRVSRADMEKNLTAKRKDLEFLQDTAPLLAPPFAKFDIGAALGRIMDELVVFLPGAPWKGST